MKNMTFFKKFKLEIIFTLIISISCVLCVMFYSSNIAKETNGNKSFYTAIKDTSKEEKQILQNCFQYIEKNNLHYKEYLDYNTYKINTPTYVKQENIQYIDSKQQFNKGDMVIRIGNTLSQEDDKNQHAYTLLILDKETKDVKGYFPLK